jgi:AmmeMemoRadiSam system protein B
VVIRPRALPPGWYPSGRGEIVRCIEEFLKAGCEPSSPACAAVAPHAGWEFSGRIACRAMRCLPSDTETVVVVGGHLGPGEGVLAAFEQGYETPLGAIEADLPLLEALRGRLEVSEDRYADNTVEIQLPFLRHLLPRARVLALRASPSQAALRLGEALAACARETRRRTAVVGSTDLTHYGPNYGFTPRGSGAAALKWVREVNDRRLVEALLGLKLEQALELALREHSACSAGGAVAAARFARELGCSRGELLEYATSHDVYPGSSFVGYAAIIYPAIAAR